MELWARRKALAKVDENRGKILNLIQDLVRVPSVDGQEKNAQMLVADRFKELGLKPDVWEPRVEELKSHPAYIDVPWGYEGRPNVVARLKGTGGGRSIILNGHIDVVSPEPLSAWTHPPWEAKVVGDRIYGRGALDMKSGIAALTYAVQSLQEAGVELKGDVILESVIEEEAGGPGGTLATILRGYKADAAVLVEPSGVERINITSTGVCWFRVKVTGKTAHAARTQQGVNAITKAMKIHQALLDLDEYRAKTKHYPLAEKYSDRSCNINVGVIRGGDWPSTVAGWAELECRVGWQVIEKMEDVKRQVEEQVRKAAELDPWMRDHPPQIEWYGWNAEASETSPKAPVVGALQRNGREVLGKEPEIVGSTGANDSRFYVLYANTPAVCYGPSGQGGHGLDEYVQVESVIQVTKVLALTLMDWCGMEKG